MLYVIFDIECKKNWNEWSSPVIKERKNYVNYVYENTYVVILWETIKFQIKEFTQHF